MSNAVAVGPVAVLAVGLAKVRRAETEKISQPAMKVFIFQRQEFFSGSQVAFHFHGVSVLHFDGGFKAGG